MFKSEEVSFPPHLEHLILPSITEDEIMELSRIPTTEEIKAVLIQAVLLHLGFNQTVTSWIISCISSVSFEVLVNGGKMEGFKPSRGLRQGDPLSSYLFILGQEILSKMLDSELRKKNLCGIKTGKSEPTITHVMYVDDIILFSKASRKDVATISRILENIALGQASW